MNESEEVAKMLSEAPDEILLKTYAALTHRIHVTPIDSFHAEPLRTQRDEVAVEILRRMSRE